MSSLLKLNDFTSSLYEKYGMTEDSTKILNESLDEGIEDYTAKDNEGKEYFWKSEGDLYGEALNDDTFTPQEAKEYWDEMHNGDPILAEYDSFEDWYNVSKENGYIKEVDEEEIEDDVNPRPNESDIRDMIDSGALSNEFVADALLRWLPDDELAKFINLYVDDYLDSEE